MAVQGCAHGDLDAVYARLGEMERAEGCKVDLLICCGDFQAVRNLWDLQCMAVPRKYKAMHSFWKYYAGVVRAPVLTLFVGGNHEASNHLWELPFGGWVAPNIYYLGDAGVVRFGGLRVAGLSGIYNSRSYHTLKFERPPYADRHTLRTAYHVRDFDVQRLMQLASRKKKPFKRPREESEEARPVLDAFFSHDWPQRIAEFGDTAALLRRKVFLRKEIAAGTLGNPAAMALLKALQPARWFSAHMHVRFEAYVPHTEAAVDSAAGPPAGRPPATRFLALDKCLGRRPCMEIVNFDVDTEVEVDARGVPLPPSLEYDDEWLAVTRAWHPLRTTATAEGRNWAPPEEGPPDLEEHLAAVRRGFEGGKQGSRRISEFDFFRTQPIHDPRLEMTSEKIRLEAIHNLRDRQVRSPTDNPQTRSMLKLLGLPPDPADFFVHPRGTRTALTADAAAFEHRPAASTAAFAMVGGMLPRPLSRPQTPRDGPDRGA